MRQLPAVLQTRPAFRSPFPDLRQSPLVRLDRPRLVLHAQSPDDFLQALDLARFLPVNLVELETHPVPVLAPGTLGEFLVTTVEHIRHGLETVADRIAVELSACSGPGLSLHCGHGHQPLGIVGREWVLPVQPDDLEGESLGILFTTGFGGWLYDVVGKGMPFFLIGVVNVGIMLFGLVLLFRQSRANSPSPA